MIEIKDFNIEKSGVYFLLNDDELIYIGETKILRKRLKEHKNGALFAGVVWINYPKIFNRVWFDKINSEKERKLKEEELISEYHPKYNDYSIRKYDEEMRDKGEKKYIEKFF